MAYVCIKLNRRSRRAFAKQRVQIGELNASIEDSLLGQKVVKAFTNEPVEIDKFEKGNLRFYDIKKETYKYMAAFQTSTRAFDGLMNLTVILMGGIFLVKGLITAGDLVAYVMYVSTLIATIRRIIEFAEQFQRGMTGIERFVQIMDSDIEIFDEPDAVPCEHPQGNIAFHNVGFEYPDDHNVVFRGLNLDIRAGEKIAIVGPSGGGKTTLCNLIPRFYDATKGVVRVNGRDVRSYGMEELREKIGMVLQKAVLFSGTIRDNLLWGKGDATDEEIWEALRLAQAKEFVEAKEGGLDAPVAQEGRNLSGGQRQRLTIARALVAKPEILILDDSASALDYATDAALRKALKELSGETTVFIVSQRASSIMHADQIIVLEDGEIAGCGTHEELLADCEVYQEIYYSQGN